jgi:hypothetical protein
MAFEPRTRRGGLGRIGERQDRRRLVGVAREVEELAAAKQVSAQQERRS